MALGKGLGSLIPQKKENVVKKSVSLAPKTETAIERVWHIPLSEITANPEQPRKHFSHKDLEDLVASIKKHGIMQPVVATERSDGGYELIAGERRFRAATVAGLIKSNIILKIVLATIPAMVRHATDQEKLELALIENIQRQNLNPIEEGFSFNRLIEEFGLTQEDVAHQVGKSRSAVANTIRLLQLPEPIQEALIEGTITAGKARALLSLKSEDEQMALFKSMTGEGVTTRDVESAVARRGPRSRKGSVRRDPNIVSQEQLVEERLGSKVRISKRGQKGSITIQFYSKDELERLIQELT